MISALLVVTTIGYSQSSQTTEGRISVSNSSQLQSALDNAKPGDVIIVKDGTFTDNFEIDRNSGTISNPITVQAENRHGVIIRGNGTTSDSNYGFRINKSYWIIDGFRFRDHHYGIDAEPTSANSNEFRHNLIYRFTRNGIRVGGNKSNIHHNVIAFGDPDTENSSAITIRQQGDDNIIDENVIYSVNDDGCQGCGTYSKKGYGLFVSAGSERNIIRGNILMAFGKGDLALLTYELGVPSSAHNMVRDNIWAYSDGGGLSARNSGSRYNSYINNLFYSMTACTAGKGNENGRNKIIHNTCIMDAFSRVGFSSAEAKGFEDEEQTFQSNIVYSALTHTGTHYQRLHVPYDYANTHFGQGIKSHNLYWAAWNKDDWATSVKSSYKFTSTEIHNPNQRPIFTDEQAGDFSLAAGSPGKNAAHDDEDIGIKYNDHLTLKKFQYVFNLPTQEKSTKGNTSVSFSGLSTAHEYQVYVYVPANSFYQGTETFTVEGKRLGRNLNDLFIKSHWPYGRYYTGNQRYVTLGNHSHDGTLNVSWTHSNVAEKIFIRQLPKVEEAYMWITGNDKQLLPPRLKLSGNR
jgi:hypothetical protein